MLTPEVEEILDNVHDLAERGEIAKAIQRLEQLRPPERADLVSDLNKQAQVELLTGLSHAVSADIVEDLQDQDAADLIADLPARTAVKIIEQMEPDEVADLLGDLPPEKAQQILAVLDASVALALGREPQEFSAHG